METIGNESKAKRFGKAAIDIVSFAALAVIIITIISVPFATVLLKLGKEEADTMSYFILSETLMLAGVFLSAWIVWHLRGFSLEGLGRSFTMRWKDWLSGILLATVLYAVGFGISLWAGAVEIAGVAFNPSSLLISLVFFLLVAVTEELALRGFVLERLLQSGVNKFCALYNPQNHLAADNKTTCFIFPLKQKTKRLKKRSKQHTKSVIQMLFKSH